MLPLIQFQPPQQYGQMMSPQSHFDPRIQPEFNAQIGNPHHDLAYRTATAGSSSHYGLASGPGSGASCAYSSTVVSPPVRSSSSSTPSTIPNGSAGTSHRTFPIRTSQPAHNPAPMTRNPHQQHVSQHEHQLRRKTPNGTIDAGYDGSPTQLATGPPPLKQMVLPAGSSGMSTLDQTLGRQRFVSQPDRWQQSGIGASAMHTMAAQPIAVLNSGRSSIGNAWHQQQQQQQPQHLQPQQQLSGGLLPDVSVVPLQSGPVVDHHAALSSLNMPQYTYHAMFNPMPGMAHQYPHAMAYCPPPVWEAGGYVPNHPTVGGRMPGIGPSGFEMYAPNPRPSLLNLGPTQRHSFGPGPQPRIVGGHRSLVDETLMANHNSGRLPMQQTQPQQQQQVSLMGMDTSIDPNSIGLQFANMHLPQDGTSRAHFREKVLDQANKIYIDLLSYLQLNRKSRARAAAPKQRVLQKLIVYPKPPKPGLSHSNNRPKLMHSLTDTTVQDFISQQRDGMHGGAGYQAIGGSNGGIGSGLAQAYGIGSGASMGSGSAQDFYSTQSTIPVSRAPAYPGFEREVNTPMANAKVSIDMLTSLCEQSDWKWIDGMLLGGCLYYGLEQYDKALEWFTRITTVQQNHAEAISNIAASFYCLNRHQEAEQHWIKAIKLRPSYLEAVEHLVGLLGANHRGRQVVEIIDFIQTSLKLTGVLHGATLSSNITSNATIQGSTSSNYQDDNATRQPGFGSSGYAIPGDENGRLLTLIHVKGNMLYALKDIDAASEAFEEAVLISAGRQPSGIQDLIHRIQGVLSPHRHPHRHLGDRNLSSPLLLPPERAKHTAQLVFGNNGDLPGLQFVNDSSSRRSAISTTSNSLLSLAKIFQDAISSGTALAGYNRRPAGVGDILALYYLSLSLMESPSTANNVGILLASVQQAAPATSSGRESEHSPNIPGIVPGTGLALALSYYQYGLHLDPKHVHLHTNLGSLLKDIGQLELAIKMYSKAVECDETFDIALTNLANAVKDRGRITEAIDYYRRAVKSNPSFAEAVCGLSTALNSVCDWRGRGGVVLYNGKFDRWHVDDDGMLQDCRLQESGSGLIERVVQIVHRQLTEASTWGKGALCGDVMSDLALQIYRAGACPSNNLAQITAKLQEWSGKPWEGSRIMRLVERATKMTMRRWYIDKYVHGTSESKDAYRRIQLPGSLAVPAAPTVLPFHTFTCPLTAKAIRMISQRNALRISCSTLRSAWIPASVYRPPAPPSPHLNVGYLSSDFNNHPLAHLMQSVFGMHNQQKVKAFCYATTASDKSIHRAQIEREAPVFRDVSSWGPDRLVDRIVADGIHILVNLNGYTRGARNEIFAARPAPIQMSFMGFAGTLGAEWCDYLLADDTAVPRSTLRPWRGNNTVSDVFTDERDAETDNWVYSENIVYCRDTFFCCDHAQSSDSSERTMTWENEQRRRWDMRKELFPTLSDDAIILGNFNQLYKIDPTTFRTWLRILSEAPKAHLWLLRFPEVGEEHLKRTAQAWAGKDVAKRIMFTDVAPKQLHISRARVCDLFLDTPECNAHTTAADVLWSSTPLLTLPRYPYKMCSRMAASILKGALPKTPAGQQAARELIADDEDRYEKLAVRLAKSTSYEIAPGGYGTGSGRLWELRRLLYDGKWTCGLFNTRRWVGDLEDAYHEAWRRWVSGEEGDIEL
ncbi:uncharacterized protein MKZ38_008923 [Zalerion maritima]|uniref:protein O-GlcNAc transferase n=1 Tax=Zalerion maritima TaxID=339359 RepID=A0AAD5RH66_9PEZI|nr:uncharacterized protein MKZ38_008923 [Zalerion maritima]